MIFENASALVIGIGSYKYIPGASIPISVADGQAVKKVLCDPNFCGYPTDKVEFLHDHLATREGILRQLDALSEPKTTERTILIFYCGHGEYGADGKYYLTTHDTQVSNGKVVAGTGISEQDLIEKLRAIPANRLLFLFNACHSGEISPSLTLEQPDKTFGDLSLPEDAGMAILSSGQGRIIITACRPEQKSWIGNGNLTIYTQALIEALTGKEKARSNGGYISAFALYEHIYSSVMGKAGKFSKIQEPELTILRGVGPFPVSLYRGAANLGDFTEDVLPANTAVKEVGTDESEKVLGKYVQIERATDGGKTSGDQVIESDAEAKVDAKQVKNASGKDSEVNGNQKLTLNRKK